MKTVLAMLAGACVAAALSPALAAKFRPPLELALNTPLACAIEDYKVIAITNTTGGTIAAGTRISYTYQRMPDHAVRSGTLATGALYPGQKVRDGIEQAFSCTAWFRRAPVAAQ